MKVLEGGVTLAKGFMAASAQAGINIREEPIWLWFIQKNLRCLCSLTNVVKQHRSSGYKSLLEKSKRFMLLC